MSNASSDKTTKPGGFPPTGPQVPWGPAMAIIASIVLFIGAQVLAGIILAIVLAAMGLSGGLAENWLDSIAGNFVFVTISDVMILLLIWLLLRRRKSNLRQLGFGRRPVWMDIGRALLGYIVYLVLLIVVSGVADSLTQIDLDQKQELGFDGITTTGQILMGFISLVILPPIVEEILFRGLVYTGLRKKLKFVWATLITSVLFAAPHLLATSDGLLWVAGIDTLVLSFILCYLREKTGALWAPMAVHALKNSVAFMALLSGVAAL